MLETLFNMDPWLVASFMGASAALYFTPGADMMFTIASGISGGPRAGLAATSGIILGILIHTALAATGLAVLIAASPLALDMIRYAGAGYLAWLAWQAWTDRGHLALVSGRSDGWRAFRRGLATNLLNPKIILFILAFLPQFTRPEAGPVWHQIVWLGLLFAAGGFVVVATIGLFAGYFAERMRRSARTMNRLTALIFGGLAAKLVLN